MIERTQIVADLSKEAGIIERYGSGIKRICDECELYGLARPVFEEFQHGFRAVLFKKRLDLTNGGVNEGVNALLMLIQHHPGERTPFFVLKLNTSVKNIERWLKKLKEDKKIEYRGAAKTGGYYIYDN